MTQFQIKQTKMDRTTNAKRGEQIELQADHSAPFLVTSEIDKIHAC